MDKERFCMLASATLILAGIGFGIAGLTIPPPGEISDSALFLIGQCFIAAASFVGIESMIIRKSNNIKDN